MDINSRLGIINMSWHNVFCITNEYEISVQGLLFCFKQHITDYFMDTLHLCWLKGPPIELEESRKSSLCFTYGISLPLRAYP